MGAASTPEQVVVASRNGRTATHLKECVAVSVYKGGVTMINRIKLYLFRRWLRKHVAERTRRTLACWIASNGLRFRKAGNL